MDETDRLDLGLLLRRHRESRALTQEDLVERAGAGLSVNTISNIERGRTRPYRHTLDVLSRALGLDTAERAALFAAWRTGPAASAPPAVAAGPPADAHVLPVPLLPLIGREYEEAAVARLLRQGDVRLLTLTGPGGVGKTRLAQQVAAGMRAAFAAGIAAVTLASIRDPALVVPTIAQALGVRDAGEEPLWNRLLTYLRDRELLLLLDNMEQVAAAPDVTALLGACTGLTVLATSRAPLRVRGEQEYAVAPLALPAATHVADLDALARVPAVALFVDRARAVRPDFALTGENAIAVAAICARLDGLPLALELAAARVKLLPPPALLARLERRLPLLKGGARDLPARQRTLRDTLTWSHDLLDTAAQVMFRRLAAFVGGCTLEVAEEVCRAVDGGARVDEDAVPADLDALVEQSLVRLEAGGDPAEWGGDGEPRLRMLETIREYALERLAASGEEHDVRRRHAASYLTLAEAAEPALLGPAQAMWLERLEREYDNLRAALQWAQESGAIGCGLRLAGALWWVWHVRGHLSEGRRWLEGLLAQGVGEAHACS